jgi:two-component system, chemotaxis family, chemotaxis protein CheY
MRILIADDEYISRRVVQEMVRGYGEVESVASGDEAVTAVRLALDESRPFDLILLDIEMPVMDGHLALREIRAEERTRGLSGRKAAKVIMTTVRSDPDSVFAAFRDQCEAYLIKPVLRESLVQNLVHLRLIAPDSIPGT